MGLDDLARDEDGYLMQPDASNLPVLTGDERFAGSATAAPTVLQFWQFAMQDLRMNNTRGYLAEFLVATALGLQVSRIEWDEYDLLWAPDDSSDEVRIEVKSSAYVQAWPQKRLSKPVFSGLRGRILDASANTYADNASYNADLYVFCVNKQTRPLEYDPLDLACWQFYVAPRTILAELNTSSVSLPTLVSSGVVPVGFDQLRVAIEQAWRDEQLALSDRNGDPSFRSSE